MKHFYPKYQRKNIHKNLPQSQTHLMKVTMWMTKSLHINTQAVVNLLIMKTGRARKHYLHKKGNSYTYKKGKSQRTNCVNNETLQVFANLTLLWRVTMAFVFTSHSSPYTQFSTPTAFAVFLLWHCNAGIGWIDCDSYMDFFHDIQLGDLL